MSFIYAMIFAGVICALSQLLAELKLPFPAIALIMMIGGGGICTKLGLLGWMNNLAAGGASVTAVGCGNGAYTGGAVLSVGVGVPLIIAALLNIALIAMGAACGTKMAGKK